MYARKFRGITNLKKMTKVVLGSAAVKMRGHIHTYAVICFFHFSLNYCFELFRISVSSGQCVSLRCYRYTVRFQSGIEPDSSPVKIGVRYFCFQV